MNIQFPKILLALVLCGIFSRPAAAQQVENVVGAAFTATFSRTTPGTAEANLPDCESL
jgi:hypothetical protein